MRAAKKWKIHSPAAKAGLKALLEVKTINEPGQA